MKAVSDESTEKVKLHIIKGADLNCKNKDGKTALMLARETGNTEITNILLATGARYFYLNP